MTTPVPKLVNRLTFWGKHLLSWILEPTVYILFGVTPVFAQAAPVPPVGGDFDIIKT